MFIFYLQREYNVLPGKAFIVAAATFNLPTRQYTLGDKAKIKTLQNNKLNTN